MNPLSLKNKSLETKNRLVVILAVFCTILVVVVWLFVLSITKPKTEGDQSKPFQQIQEQVSSIMQQSKLEKIPETTSALKNTLETLPGTETTPGQGTVSSTP